MIEDSNYPVVDNESGNRQFYDEFLNCTTNNYNIPDKQDSESISSDGEFNEFNDFKILNEDDDELIRIKYLKLIQQKYSNCQQSTLREFMDL